MGGKNPNDEDSGNDNDVNLKSICPSKRLLSFYFSPQRYLLLLLYLEVFEKDLSLLMPRTFSARRAPFAWNRRNV